MQNEKANLSLKMKRLPKGYRENMNKQKGGETDFHKNLSKDERRALRDVTKAYERMRGGGVLMASNVPTMPSSYSQAMGYAGYPMNYANSIQGSLNSTFTPFMGPQSGNGFFDFLPKFIDVSGPKRLDLQKGGSFWSDIASPFTAIGKAVGVTGDDNIGTALFKGAIGPLTLGIKGARFGLDTLQSTTGEKPSDLAQLAGPIGVLTGNPGLAAKGEAASALLKKSGRGRQAGGQGIAQRPEYQMPGLYMQGMQNASSFSMPIVF